MNSRSSGEAGPASGSSARLEQDLERYAERIDRAVDRYGLPLHVVFLDELKRIADGFQQTLARLYPEGVVLFAVKSNPCRGALRAAAGCGLGADTASEHELRAALEEAIPAERIVCNGNAKSESYLRLALEAGAFVAVDNEDELNALFRLAAERKARPAVLLRFRGMPLAGLTSDDQSTAADWTKFGFDISEADALFARMAKQDRLHFAGVSAHIGTQIADSAGYERLLRHFFDLANAARGRGLDLEVLDIGGGFPVSFLSAEAWQGFQRRLLARLRGAADIEDSVTWNDLPMGYSAASPEEASPPWTGKAYWSAHPGVAMLDRLLNHRFPGGATTIDRLRDLGSPSLIVEPGRSLFAPCGVTLARVMGVKVVLGHNVVALDMGINNHGTNLISPDIFSVAVWPRRSDDEPTEAFLAGRLCFSGDMISKTKVQLNRLPRRGERFAICQTGAYCADHFASNSCGFPIPAKIAVAADGRVELWRRPQQYEDVFGPLD